MNIRDITKPVTAKSLNESLSQRFGTKINLEAFTLEQLQDARNKLRTQISQVETNESFNVTKTESYQKSKLFLDVLNAAVKERSVIEAAKPDFADLDKDGNKKEPMKKAAKDAKKKKANESTLREGAEDHAELVMAAKDMVDRITAWMEDTAEMQTETMLELADAIRDEMGSEGSEAFVNAVKPALEALYAEMENTRSSLTQGVGQLTGEAEPTDTMGAEDTMGDMDTEMEPTVDGEEGVDSMDTELDPAADLEGGDEFAGDAAAAGGEEEAGRAKRESIERKVSKKK